MDIPTYSTATPTTLHPSSYQRPLDGHPKAHFTFRHNGMELAEMENRNHPVRHQAHDMRLPHTAFQLQGFPSSRGQ